MSCFIVVRKEVLPLIVLLQLYTVCRFGKKNDIVWTSQSLLFHTNCAVYCGAKVDFIDINPITYNLDINHLEEKLVKSKKMVPFLKL